MPLLEEDLQFKKMVSLHSHSPSFHDDDYQTDPLLAKRAEIVIEGSSDTILFFFDASFVHLENATHW